MKALSEMTEQELRDYEVPRPKSIEELNTIIGQCLNRTHDYGTCIYAMSIAATAAFNFIASNLGVTGFQASMADMNILARTRNWKWGKLLDYKNLLYPQYCNEEHFPSWQTLIREEEELGNEARKLLAEKSLAHPEVREHWEMLSRLHPLKEQSMTERDEKFQGDEGLEDDGTVDATYEDGETNESTVEDDDLDFAEDDLTPDDVRAVREEVENEDDLEDRPEA